MLLVLILGICATVSSSSLRSKRQYGTEDYDPVTGALIGECTFYGDFTVDCSGRLTCRPQDLEDRPTLATLERTCPKETGLKSGRWDRDQVVPSNMIPRDAGSGRICKCQFYANRGSGNFKCTGVQGDTWKGTYTGSLNTAFRLGLTQSAYGPGSRGTGTSGSLGANDYSDRYGTSSSGRRTGDDDYSATNRDRDYSRGTTGRDDYSGGRYSTSLGRENDRDNDALNTRYQSSYGSTGRDRDRESAYPRTTTNEVVMCTYTTDGKGKCRDCSERIDRKESTTEIRTTKHYTCSGPETKTTWSEDNGIMPRGTRPDPYAYTNRLVATCIFDKLQKTFNCHGSSSEGNCSTDSSYGSSSSSRYGDSSTPQRCLGGEKWSGTYRGAVYSV